MRKLPLPSVILRLVAIVVLAGILAGGVIWLRRATENRIVVMNRSGQALSRMTVGVYNSGSNPTFLGLPDGAKASVTFDIRGDGGFFVEGSLADGTRIKGGTFGYVTGGMFGERARFVVGPGGEIEFSQGKD